jgi:hypothetical protein
MQRRMFAFGEQRTLMDFSAAKSGGPKIIRSLLAGSQHASIGNMVN